MLLSAGQLLASIGILNLNLAKRMVLYFRRKACSLITHARSIVCKHLLAVYYNFALRHWALETFTGLVWFPSYTVAVLFTP